MADADYWKKQYKETWAQSSQRELTIAKLLEDESGKKIEPVGLGAGSADFLSGTASERGYTKGDADFIVAGTNIHLEVTGPLVKSVDERQDLWVRPDKIANAKQNVANHETWVIHHLPKGDLIRVVLLGDEFFNALDNNEFLIVTPRIRGSQERYYAIPVVHRCVKSLDALIDRLTKF